MEWRRPTISASVGVALRSEDEQVTVQRVVLHLSQIGATCGEPGIPRPSSASVPGSGTARLMVYVPSSGPLLFDADVASWPCERARRRSGHYTAEMRLVALMFAGWTLLSASVTAQVTSESDLLGRLSSPNVAERREAARSLDPEKIGNLEPELAVRAVLMAAQDTDPSVRQWALGGLAILAAA